MENDRLEALSGRWRAILAALKGQIATLVVPHDYQLAESEGGIVKVQPSRRLRSIRKTVDRAAALLNGSTPAALMLGGKALGAEALAAVARIKAATGCDLFTETFPSRWERGAGLPVMAERTSHRADEPNPLRNYRAVVLVGMNEPVTFVGQLGFDSRILGEGQEKSLPCSAPVGCRRCAGTSGRGRSCT